MSMSDQQEIQDHQQYDNQYDQNYEQKSIQGNQNREMKKSDSQEEYEQERNRKNTSKRNRKHDQDNYTEENQSQQRSHSQSSSSQEIEPTQERKLQNYVLDLAVQQEQSTLYQAQLTRQLFQKLRDFQYLTKSKSGQDLITIRIQQLVINKILVLTYNKSEFRLILAHYRLGQAYLLNECIQQSIEHISLALHKIQKIFDVLKQARLLQTQMQNELAKALILKENFQDAIQLLNSSISQETRLKELRREHEPDAEQGKNTKALTLLSQCYSKINQYQQALQVIEQVLEISKNKKMAKIEYSFALVEKAKILALQKKYADAIVQQEKAIDILMEQNYSKPEEVAQLYTVLSSYHEELNNVENALTCIQKVKTLYQQLYSAQDKRVIKARRKIATFLLKSQRFKQAVNQLLQVVQLQEKVFGQNSLQTARTLKLLGAVYISMQVADARAYLKRAMNIFQSHGNKKQVQEIRQKLKMLYNGNQIQGKDIRITGSEHQI